MPNKKDTGNKKSDDKRENGAISSTTENKEKGDKDKSIKKIPIFKQVIMLIVGKYHIRYNVMTNTWEWKLKHRKKYKPLNKNDILSELMEKGFSRVKEIVNVYLGSSKIERYHPVRNYLEDLPEWDGVDHIQNLANFVQTKDQACFERHLKKYLINVVAAGLGKIKFNKYIFTLVGGQNSGKTSWLRFLVSIALKMYYSEDIDFNSKEGRIALSENWFICLDEFDSIPYRDIPKIKKFTSTEVVKERRVYGTNSEQMDRIANFTATVNKEEFLQDETGNVRWLIHEVISIKHDFGGKNGYEAKINMDKVYSQIKHLILNEKVPINFSSNEIREINKRNSKYLLTPNLKPPKSNI